MPLLVMVTVWVGAPDPGSAMLKLTAVGVATNPDVLPVPTVRLTVKVIGPLVVLTVTVPE